MALVILLVLWLTIPLSASAPKSDSIKIHDEGLYLEINQNPAQKILSENKLICCLIEKESNGNPEAVGDNGKAYGILQFWKSTFESYAKKYNLQLDYKNPEDQIYLAWLMIEDNPKNAYHWTTYKLCKGR